MAILLIEENSYQRVKNEIEAVSPDIEVVLINPEGCKSSRGEKIEAETIKPEMAWLNIEILLSGLMEKFTRLVLKSDSIKWIQTFMAGLDQPFYGEMLKKGIRITKGNAQAIAIAEYVLTNVLAQYQDVFTRRRKQRAHEWKLTGFRELWHTQWLLIGFGNIGQEIARRIRAFECEVIAVKRTVEPHPLADTVIPLDRVSDYLPSADVVVLACALNEETRELAGRAFFQKMKKNATFVNIARGKLVKQAEMIEALKEGMLSRAILDVFDPEPLEGDSPLWDMDQVIITPHSSNAGSGTRTRGDSLFLENLRRYLKGQALVNEAFPDRL